VAFAVFADQATALKAKDELNVRAPRHDPVSISMVAGVQFFCLLCDIDVHEITVGCV